MKHTLASPSHSHSTLSPLHSSAAVLAPTKSEEFSVVFVGDHLTGVAGDLFLKMIQAMGLDYSQIKIVAPVELLGFWNKARSTVWVTLGQSALEAMHLVLSADEMHAARHPERGQWFEILSHPILPAQPQKVMPTFHPSELVAHPELKRPAWDDLKSVAQALGIVLPTARKPTS